MREYIYLILDIDGLPHRVFKSNFRAITYITKQKKAGILYTYRKMAVE